MRRDCRHRAPSRETGGRPTVARTTGSYRECVSQNGNSTPEHVTVGCLDLKVGKFPVVVDTVVQFSCVRSGVVYYLSLRGECCTFLPSSLSCLFAYGSKAQVIETVRLHVSSPQVFLES